MLNRLTIRSKVIAVFSALTLVALALGLASFIGIGTVRSNGETIEDNYVPSIQMVAEMETVLLLTRLSEVNHMLADNAATKATHEAAMKDRGRDMADLLSRYRPLITTDAESRLFAAVEQAWEAYLAANGRLVALSNAGQRDEAEALFEGASLQARVGASKALDALEHFNEEAIVQAGLRGDSAFTTVLVVVSLMLALVVAIAAGGVLMMLRGVTAPIGIMTAAMRRLADGDRTIDVPGKERSDEIGGMAQALEVFKQNAIEADRLAAEQRKDQEVKLQRAARIGDLISRFEGQIAGIMGNVSSATTQLDGTARGMNTIADRTLAEAAASAAAAEQTAANVQTVASAAEEMSASIQEIAQQVAKSTAAASQAVEVAESTGATMRDLAEAAGRIGSVVSLIQEIAGQTNLLALNATIEAARAGEAGKGFAVVASEVKSLANQTAKATEEIASQINGIQNATTGAVAAMDEIARAVSSLNAIAANISAAVEEQNATTVEISRNVQQAAAGTVEVSQSVATVRAASSETGQAAGEVLSAVAGLTAQATDLRREVDGFLSGIRAA